MDRERDSVINDASARWRASMKFLFPYVLASSTSDLQLRSISEFEMLAALQSLKWDTSRIFGNSS